LSIHFVIALAGNIRFEKVRTHDNHYIRKLTQLSIMLCCCKFE